jgi:hypothetical protein
MIVAFAGVQMACLAWADHAAGVVAGVVVAVVVRVAEAP